MLQLLKLMIQADLHVAFFFKIFFKNYFLFKRLYWYMTLLQWKLIFEQMNNHEVSCNQSLAWNIFCNNQFGKYKCNSAHCYNEKSWVDILSYVVFPWKFWVLLFYLLSSSACLRKSKKFLQITKLDVGFCYLSMKKYTLPPFPILALATKISSTFDL